MKTRARTFLFVALLVLLFAGSTPAQQTDAAWRAGVASVVITPETNLWMAGYAARNKPAEGKAQDLFAKALALDDGQGGRLVIVTMDLIGVPRTLRLNLARRLGEAHKLPPQSLLLNASHTHCGPEFRVGRAPADDGEFKPSTLGERYGAQLEDKLFDLVGRSLTNLAPARLSYSHARCGFAMNRRLPAGDTYRNSAYADGPVDHDVPVLRVTSADGKQLRALLFGYACHNTTLSFYQWCGDYAGFAQEYLQTAHPETVAMFVTGFGADQNPYPRGTLELAQQHGRALANAVEAALLANATPVSGSLKAAYAEIDLRYAAPPSKEEFQKRLASSDRYEKQHAERMLARMEKEGRLPVSYPYPVQAVRFGGTLTLVALGGEVVVDYSLRLKRELAGPAVWLAGYSNDVMGYIPSERVLAEGGYEGGGAMRFSVTHPGPWAAGLEEQIVGKVKELLRGLK
jgi:neutral ceramidase